MKEALNPLSWKELSQYAAKTTDLVHGVNNPYSLLRLFDDSNSAPRVVLYRDRHAWCPYCQKIWLWLEWKRIPYKIKKINMRCYGKKEDWYLKKVPSGMFPAIELDKELVTESDQILLRLEKAFGPLGMSMEDQGIIKIRNLERKLFRAWCIWLCNPSFTKGQELRKGNQFKEVAKEVDNEISKTNSPWIDPSTANSPKSIPGSVDIIFIPRSEEHTSDWSSEV